MSDALRLRNPRITALINKSGVVVLVGGRSREDALRSAEKVCIRISSFVPTVCVTSLRFKNIVVSCCHEFDLSSYWNTGSSSVIHDAEIFAGLRVSLSNGVKATLSHWCMMIEGNLAGLYSTSHSTLASLPRSSCEDREKVNVVFTTVTILQMTLK